MSGFLDDLPDLGSLDNERPQRPRRKPSRNVVVFHHVRCPKCGSPKNWVYNSNHVPVRYHRCHGCGMSFKSVEVGYRPTVDACPRTTVTPA